MRRYAIIGILVFMAILNGCAATGPVPDEYMEMSKDSKPPAVSYPVDEAPGRDDMTLGVKDPDGVWSLRRVKHADILGLIEDSDIPPTIARDSELPDISAINAAISDNTGDIVVNAQGIYDNAQDIANNETEIEILSANGEVQAQIDDILRNFAELSTLADGEVYGATTTETPYIAGEAISVDYARSAYYLKSVSDEKRVFIYRADSTSTDNATYGPDGIICPDDLPVEAGSPVTVTEPGQGWAFRNDAEGLINDHVGYKYYLGASGYWTDSHSDTLGDTGDIVCDFGKVASVSPTIIVSNPTATIRERQADGSLLLQDFPPPPSAPDTTAPTVVSVELLADGTTLKVQFDERVFSDPPPAEGTWTATWSTTGLTTYTHQSGKSTTTQYFQGDKQVQPGETTTGLAYARNPASGTWDWQDYPAQEGGGNYLASFTGQAIFNGSYAEIFNKTYRVSNTATGDDNGAEDSASWADAWQDYGDINWPDVVYQLSMGNDVAIYFKKGEVWPTSTYGPLMIMGSCTGSHIDTCTLYTPTTTSRLYVGVDPNDIGSKPIVRCNVNYGDGIRFKANGYITVNGMQIESTVPYTTNIGAIHGIHGYRLRDDTTRKGHIVLTNNTFKDIGFSGITLEKMGDWNIVQHNDSDGSRVLFYPADEGTDTVVSSYNLFSHNISVDNDWSRAAWKDDRHVAGLQATSDSIIEHNTSYQCGDVPYVTWGWTDKTMSRNIFRYNIIDETKSNVFSIGAEDKPDTIDKPVDNHSNLNMVYGNVIIQPNQLWRLDNKNHTPYGEVFFRKAQADSDTANSFFHNTSYLVHDVGLKIEESSSVHYLNNISVLDPNYSQAFNRVQLDDDLNIDGNLYWVAGYTSGQDYWQGSGFIADGGPTLNWTEWKAYAGRGFDANSPNPADPLFVNAGGEDYRLQASSPAVDEALPLACVNNSGTGSGSGTVITVDKPYFFHSNFDLKNYDGTDVARQKITFDDATNGAQTREVVSVNYSANTITVNSSINYLYDVNNRTDRTKSTQVYLGEVLGSAADIGAIESH